MRQIKILDFVEIAPSGCITFPLHKIEKIYQLIYLKGYRCCQVNNKMVYFIIKDQHCKLIKYSSFRSIIYKYLEKPDFTDRPDRHIEILNAFCTAKGIINHDLLCEYLETKLTESQTKLLQEAMKHKKYSLPEQL